MRYSNTARVILIALLIAATGLSLALHGWRWRTPNYDLLTSIDSAHELIASGQIPDRGTLTSFASYAPPGTTWLILPGTLLFRDPRLYEYIGSSILYLGTLVGIFLLTRAYFGVGCALLAVAIYGLSERGIFYAASLQQRGHPFFFVWMVYWIRYWVVRRKTTYLAAAIVTWAAGMYLFLEIAPAIFILPIVWLLYRPPFKLQPLFLGGILALIIWYPYLKFEYTRNFVDLRSQVARQRILPANYKDSWCDPGLILADSEAGVVPSLVKSNQTLNATDSIRNKVLQLLMPLWGNFELVIYSNLQPATSIPGISIALMFLFLISLFLLGVSGDSIVAAEIIDRRWRYWLSGFAVGMILLGVLWNELIIARYLSLHGFLQPSTITSIRWLQLILVLSGITLLMLRNRIIGIVRTIELPAIPAEEHIQNMQHPENARLLVLSFLIPWLVLLFIADNDTRFWWLWPLPCVVLAASVTHIPSRLQMSRLVTTVVSALLIFMLVANCFLLWGEAPNKAGWAGADPEEVQVVDYVYSLLQGRKRAAIGYQVFFPVFLPAFNAVDPRYKVGADFDLLFKDRHGVSNTNRCAEGVSPYDEFRILQTELPRYKSGNWVYFQSGRDPSVKYYFTILPDKSFSLLRQIGPFQVFRRGTEHIDQVPLREEQL